MKRVVSMSIVSLVSLSPARNDNGRALFSHSFDVDPAKGHHMSPLKPDE